MSIEEIAAMDVDWLTPDIVAKNLGVNPQSIRDQAAMDKDKLGFPVSVCGHRVRIPRQGYIAFVTGGAAPAFLGR